MSNFLNTNFQVNFVKESPPENLKLMSLIKKQISTSYKSGEKILQSGDKDIALIDLSTNFYIISEKYIDVTLNTGETFKNIEVFAYSSKVPLAVTISNAATSENLISYAAGTVTDNTAG